MRLKAQAAILIAVAVAIPLAGQPYGPKPRPVRKLAEMEPVLARIAAWEYSQSREPLYDFAEFLQGALGSPAELQRIESRLLRILESDATLAGKDFVCRQLSFIGTEASAPVLAGMLARPETNDMARYALERIPGPAPGEALRGALAKTSGKAKVGVINSLGQRGDAKSVPALASLIGSPDEGISEAAVAALAAIGNQPALKALAAGRRRLNGIGRLRASEAYLRCAGSLAAAGNRAAALKVYRELKADGEPEMIRVAALSGLAAVAGKESIPELESNLASRSPKVQAAAIRLLNDIPGPEITRLLAGTFAKLSPAGQVRVLAALGGRGDAGARPLVTAALQSADPGVRIQALAALGRLGDGASAMTLAGVAAKAGGSERDAARQSLYTLRGTDVEAAIVTGIGSATGGARIELIRAAGERGISAAADALVSAARDPDREVRRESVRALRSVAGPAQSTALLTLLLGAQSASDRREVSATLAAALRRSSPPSIGEAIAAYQAEPNPQIRAALLDVMGKVSAGEALPVLRRSLTDSDPEIARAAILALSEWMTPDPMQDLLTAARSAANPAHRVLALRGFIKLIPAPSNRSMSDTAGLLAEAMRLAAQPEEKRAVLALLPDYPTQETLRIAQALVEDGAVAREARYAVSRIRLALGAESEK